MSAPEPTLLRAFSPIATFRKNLADKSRKDGFLFTPEGHRVEVFKDDHDGKIVGLFAQTYSSSILNKAINIALKMVSDKGRPAPAVYGKTEKDFENLAKRTDIDGVVIATPWEWHVPMALEVMSQGKYAGVEVSATVT